MQIILSRYDGGYVETMMIGKQMFTDMNLTGICGAIDDRNIPEVYKQLQILLAVNGIRETNSYNFIKCEDGCIVKLMMSLDHENVCNYCFISNEGRTEGREAL